MLPRYSQLTTYRIGDKFYHPSFGVCEVFEVRDRLALTRFDGGQVTLAHDRARVLRAPSAAPRMC
jgi:hypothetical protein